MIGCSTVILHLQPAAAVPLAHSCCRIQRCDWYWYVLGWHVSVAGLPVCTLTFGSAALCFGAVR